MKTLVVKGIMFQNRPLNGAPSIFFMQLNLLKYISNILITAKNLMDCLIDYLFDQLAENLIVNC